MIISLYICLTGGDSKLNIFEIGSELIDAIESSNYLDVIQIFIRIRKQLGDISPNEKSVIAYVEKVVTAAECLLRAFRDDIDKLFAGKQILYKTHFNNNV